MLDGQQSPIQGDLFQGSLSGELPPASIAARPAKRTRAKTAKKLPNFDQRQWQAVREMADVLDSKDTLRPGEEGVEKERDPRAGSGRPALRIESVAGSGKSSVAMGAIGEMSRVSGLLLATFGKKIQVETERRIRAYHPDTIVNDIPLISSRTVNSLGLAILNREINFGGFSSAKGPGEKPAPGERVYKGTVFFDYNTKKRPEGRVNKYREISEEVGELPSLAEVLGTDDRGIVRTSGLLKLFEFCRYRLIREPSADDIEALALELGLDFEDPQEPEEPSRKPWRSKWERLADGVQEIIQKGLQMEPFEYTCDDGHIDVYSGLIDGTDQLWIPFMIGGKPAESKMFRCAVVDEYQDLSPLQLWVVTQYLHPDSPIVFIGDRRQCIFSFLGAGQSTFDLIEELFPCETLQLTDSYRCPESHLAIARHFHPHIKRAAALPPDPPGSAPQVIDGEDMFDLLSPGDVVVGRSTAALVEAGLTFMLRQKIDPKTGKMMGVRITVPKLSGLLISAIEGVSRLWRKKTGAKRMSFQRDFREALAFARDQAPEGGDDALRLLDVLFEFAHDRKQGRTQRDFINYVAQLVESPNLDSDKNKVGRSVVNFKTIHAFKGMEASRVFVVSLGLTGDYWQTKLSRPRYIEEMNLSYVALTRSTRELYLVPGFHSTMRDIGELVRNPVPRPQD